MAATQTKQVKVHIEVEGMNFDSSGSVDEVLPQLIRFLSGTVPTYHLAKKLLYTPDLAGLADKVSEYAKMTNDGQLLITRNELPADEAVNVVLFMAHLTGKIGKRESDSLSIEQLATAVGKAPKTIRNSLVNLQKNGLIERAERGNYRITQKGLMELENSLPNPTQKTTS